MDRVKKSFFKISKTREDISLSNAYDELILTLEIYNNETYDIPKSYCRIIHILIYYWSYR